jgi:hypothetical protein
VPVRSILVVVRDAVAHTPPVLATCAELREIAGESLILSSSSPLWTGTSDRPTSTAASGAVSSDAVPTTRSAPA